MRLDYQISLKSPPPLNSLAGSAPTTNCIYWKSDSWRSIF